MEKWVAALRSGKYEQGKAALKTGDRFCCLGVLCDISQVGKFDKNDCFKTESGIRTGYLSKEVEEWAGIKKISHPPIFKLILMNDTGKTFTEIADNIEQNWEQL